MPTLFMLGAVVQQVLIKASGLNFLSVGNPFLNRIRRSMVLFPVSI
jgi:hypothetical protein